MAEKTGYPQIPGRVWWGIRDLLNRSPGMKFEDSNLAATLDVQLAAARQYLSEMKRIGVLGDDGAATDLGKKWRLDDDYDAAVAVILEGSYPASLISIAPPGSADRAMVEKWFVNSGLGSGTAKNKAGTYVMIANDRPGETRVRASAPQPKRDDNSTAKSGREKQVTARASTLPIRGSSGSLMPLNLNVQIHISAEATSEQIEKIFASMRKNLYDPGVDSAR